jgi:hypothetical protein
VPIWIHHLAISIAPNASIIGKILVAPSEIALTSDEFIFYN